MKSRGSKLSAACLLSLHAGAACFAGEADVIDATVQCDPDRRCTFAATVSHADTGWDHYADHWRILGPGGDELGRRTLLHPHETEQPFTRSLSGITLPGGVKQVTVQAHDNVHGYGGAAQVIDLP